MKILLLGGTGTMGSHLINILAERGHKIVVTSRSIRESTGSVEFRQGNAKDMHFIESLLHNGKWDAIVDFMIYSKDSFSKRLELLLGATGHYIFLSSARVYNDSKVAITEESERLLDTSIDRDFLSTDEYSLTKARQEDILQSSKQKNWTIIRPYITYGTSRLQLGTLEKEKWLYRAIKGRTIVVSKDVDNHLTTLTYGFDVANGIANIINNPNSFREIYHITNNYYYKWSDILEIYLKVLEKKLGKRPKVFYQDMSNFLKWNPGVYQIKYDRLFDRKFDNTKINNCINTEEFVPIHQGLEKSLNAFFIDSKFKNISWREEAIKDRYVKERTPLSEIPGFKNKIRYIIFRYIAKL